MAKNVVNKTPQSLFVNSSTAKTICDYLIAKGIDEQKITDAVSCSIDSFSKIDSRLSLDRYHALWHLALEFTKEPNLGLKLAKNPYNEEMGLVAHIFFNSPTLLAGLRQYERYYSLVNEGMHIEVTTDDRLAYVSFISDHAKAYCDADMEHNLAISVIRVKQNISASLSLEAVHFQHAEPKDTSLHELLFNCPVLFNQKHCSLIFKREHLEFKLPKRSAYLYKILIGHIETLSKKFLPKSSFTDKVSTLIKKQLAKDFVDAEHIAEKLFMSRHTLYRKLKQENAHFHELVDDVRKERAYFYLHQDKHSLSEIAFLLGFSELSAFSRAFKRWTGKSPAKYVKSLED